MTGSEYQATHDSLASESRRYYGLRGWLALVGLGLCFGVFAYASQAYTSAIPLNDGTLRALKVSGGGGTTPMFSAILRFEVASGLALSLGSMYALCLYFLKSARFPSVYIAWLVAGLAVVMIDLGAAASMMGQSEVMKAALEPEIKQLQSRVPLAILSTVIWVAYMRRSKRVRATFYRESELELEPDGSRAMPTPGTDTPEPAQTASEGAGLGSSAFGQTEGVGGMQTQFRLARRGRPWLVVFGAFWLFVGFYNSSKLTVDPSDWAGILGAVVGQLITVALGIGLVLLGLAKGREDLALVKRRRRLWLKLLGLGFLVMVVLVAVLLASSQVAAANLVLLGFWLGWTWMSWWYADRKARTLDS